MNILFFCYVDIYIYISTKKTYNHQHYLTSVVVNSPQVIHILATAVSITDRKLGVTVEIIKIHKPSIIIIIIIYKSNRICMTLLQHNKKMKQNMMRVVVVEILRKFFIIPRKELYIYIARAVSPLYRKETSEGIMFNERNSQFVRYRLLVSRLLNK